MARLRKMLTEMRNLVYNKYVEVNSGNGLGIFHLPPYLNHFCQLNTFGGRTPDFTFNTTGIPLVPLLASTPESGVKSGAFSFLPKIDDPGRCANINQGLSKANPQEKAMPNRDFTNSPQDGANLTHLSEAELSALLDLINSQIEFHRDELTRLKPILHRLEANIPNDSFAEFISTLELGE